MNPARILIVDDYQNLVELMALRLRAEGYEVITAFDGMQGLQLARTQHPDLVILDVLLPKMDGFKVCRLLKFDERFRKTPIIMLTSRARDIDRQMGMDMGADAYFLKPYDPSILLREIHDRICESPSHAPVQAA
ncbi:MAG: response regulator [Bacteroidetes bacterium]|nr:response regulator [Bacteroidota bacterium]